MLVLAETSVGESQPSRAVLPRRLIPGAPQVSACSKSTMTRKSHRKICGNNSRLRSLLRRCGCGVAIPTLTLPDPPSPPASNSLLSTVSNPQRPQSKTFLCSTKAVSPRLSNRSSLRRCPKNPPANPSSSPTRNSDPRFKNYSTSRSLPIRVTWICTEVFEGSCRRYSVVWKKRTSVG